MAENEKLVEAVKNAASEVKGRMVLPCAKAFAVAEELDAKIRDIGRICDDNNIRIVACQLGCFQ